jgi:large subunit ribosomal protein L22
MLRFGRRREKAEVVREKRGPARARARLIRMTPRKVRRVINLIRGQDVNEALALLDFVNARPAPMIKKILRQAQANASQNYEMDEDNLYVSAAFVDEGLTIPRIRPRAQGRAYRIRKRTSHITIEVAEREE